LFNVCGGFQYRLVILLSGKRLIVDIYRVSFIDDVHPMNDQQEVAPRPNDLTLDPTYRGFTFVPTTGMRRTPSLKPLHKGIYAFAFDRKGLIAGVDLRGTKVTPIHPE
jgi:hypothetical protein